MTAQCDMRDDVAVLVPAAGMGVRLGPGGPKALRLLAGQPLLTHAIRAIISAGVGHLVIAAPPGEEVYVGSLLGQTTSAGQVTSVTVVTGGDTRQASVAAALAAVPSNVSIVLVHDAARALAPPSLIHAVIAAVRAGHDAVIPVLPVVDTIKEVSPSGLVTGTVDRSVLRAVQTPQGFRRELLAAAHASAADEHTDDAGLVERLGVRVFCVPGDERALKITRPYDLLLAEALLAADHPGTIVAE